jgi:hypothetical protein
VKISTRICSRRSVSVLATVMALLIVPVMAGAVTNLTFESPGSEIFQQTQNSPCVIGEASCNQPAGFPSTLIPVQTDSTQVSPTYTVGQITAIVGDTFFVGLDVNQATQNVPPYTVTSFTLAINGVVEFELTGNNVTTLVNNGNGFSDALIKTFDLSSFAATDTAVFSVSYINDTDGREQYFLIGTETPPAVPEPITMALGGTGLLAMGYAARKYLGGLGRLAV